MCQPPQQQAAPARVCRDSSCLAVPEKHTRQQQAQVSLAPRSSSSSSKSQQGSRLVAALHPQLQRGTLRLQRPTRLLLLLLPLPPLLLARAAVCQTCSNAPRALG